MNCTALVDDLGHVLRRRGSPTPVVSEGPELRAQGTIVRSSLSKAALAYHTNHEATLGEERNKLLSELFLDLNEDCNDWHLTSTDPLQMEAS